MVKLECPRISPEPVGGFAASEGALDVLGVGLAPALYALGDVGD